MNKYRIKIVDCDGAKCISVLSTRKQYVEEYAKAEDPKGVISPEYSDKKYKRFSIINKLRNNERKDSMGKAPNERQG